ncbi:MAG: hypothetical protein ABIG60_04605 [Patescibacteria group bacterium]
MSIATAFCWSAFLFVLTTVDPFKTNWLGFILFYLSFFLAVSGTTAIAGFIIRFIALKRELVFYSVKIAFRQSFLFSFFLAAILFLLANNLFTWLNLFLLIIGLSVLEYFLISYGSRYLKHRTGNIGQETGNTEQGTHVL